MVGNNNYIIYLINYLQKWVFNHQIQYDQRGYSQIILAHDNSTRYRYIRNPSLLIRIYYWKFDKDMIFVKLYQWDFS